MGDSIAHSSWRAPAWELPAWKTFLSVSCAILLGLLFIVSGTWKIVDPLGAGSKIGQALTPLQPLLSAKLIMPFTALLGVVETFTGALLMVPRFRRWGAWLAGGMLIVFMLYVGVFYNQLRGEDCSCFPWLKRAVGPGFFIGDAVMLLLAVPAGLWAQRSRTARTAVFMLAALLVFAGASYAVNKTRLSGAQAPDAITVEGKPYSLTYGKVLLYFFDPECMHCDAAARKMAKLQWEGTRLVAIPYGEARFAKDFLRDTGLPAKISNDLDLLHKSFPAIQGPHAVALEHGRQKEFITNFDDGEPAETLRRIGFVQ